MQTLTKGIVSATFDSSRVLARSLHASSSAHNEAAQPDKSTKLAKKTTKKKYSALPTQRLLPDGTIAPPMPIWDGGLGFDAPVILAPRTIETHVQTPSKPTRKTRSSSKAIEVESLEEPAPKLRKPRTKKGETSRLSAEDEPTVVTRKRVSKKDTNEVSEVPRTHLATEILHNLDQYPNCILLTRVGKFYESYFDQALEVSAALSIKLSQRIWGGHRVITCGFPVTQLDKYLKILVQQNKRFVAMCEEMPRDPTDTGNFERRVIRVVTPGTLIDESFVNQYENNYLLAIGTDSRHTETESAAETISLGDPVGLAWIDVSTGEFFTKTSTYGALCDELARIGPREIVLHKNLEELPAHPIRKAILEEGGFTSFTSLDDVPSSQPMAAPGGDMPTFNFAAPISAAEAASVSLLTKYLQTNLLDSMPSLAYPKREVIDGRMQIDAHTIKALEIKESMNDGGTASSLLNVIKRTVTSSGTRLLSRWLCSPSTSVRDITTRQSLVAFWQARSHLRSDLSAALANADDAVRIIQKFTLGRGDPGDMSALSKTITVWTSIRKEIEQQRDQEERDGRIGNDWASIDALTSRLTDFRELSEKISAAIVKVDLGSDGDEVSENLGNVAAKAISDVDGENGDVPAKQDRWSIRPEYSPKLQELHEKLVNLDMQRRDLLRELQRKHGLPSLSLRSTPGQGQIVHIGKSKRDGTKLPSPEFVQITASAGTATFFHGPWSRIGTDTMQTIAAIKAEEAEAFQELRREIILDASKLRQNARTLDEIDITLAFSNLASEMNFVRPSIEEDSSYTVVNGRHPTVELGLLSTGRVFTPNTVSFTNSSKLHVLTGPNMAGKSTLLRQTALIAILAQIGAYVPADYAVVGIVDKLFSRIGAKDDLFRDRSTFMVEMLETAEILRRATPRSLVIMDEVGRGTTVKDGLAIAFATVHHITTQNQCRALFATHFHELSDMLGYSSDNKGQGVFKNVAFCCTDVDETDDSHFAYSYRLRPGVNRDSHGLKVAQLAGMPESVVGVAKGALSWLKGRKEGETVKARDLALLGETLSNPMPPA